MQHTIVGKRGPAGPDALWDCDGCNHTHAHTKWGFIAYPFLVFDDGTQKKIHVYCAKRTRELCEEIEKAEAILAKQEAEQPKVVAPPSGLLEVSGGEVREVHQAPDIQNLTLSPVRVESEGLPVVGGPPDPVV